MKFVDKAPGVVVYYLDAADKQAIDSYIARSEQDRSQWVESATMGRNDNYRTSRSFHISKLKTTQAWVNDWDRLVFETFNKALTLYQARYGLHIDKDEGYELLCYSNGGEYKKHCDAGGHQFGRIVSGLLYCNDNYTGGELELTQFNIKMKPERGTLLLFPSNYIYEHIAHPVIEGQKYAIVTFFHPMDETIERNKDKGMNRPNVSYSSGATNL